jgi:hypothetical protein
MECTITEDFGKEKNFLAPLDKSRTTKLEDRIQKKEKILRAYSDF